MFGGAQKSPKGRGSRVLGEAQRNLRGSQRKAENDLELRCLEGTQ